MTVFWSILVAVGILAAVVNFGLGLAHRDRPLHALLRFTAGVVSLVPAIGILVARFVLNLHPLAPLELHDANTAKYVFIIAGLFVGATLTLPAYLERSGGETQAPSLQERAARPANATVRLQKNADEWVN